MFSRRWAADEVPGISMMFSECCSSQDRATAVGVAPSRLATGSSTSDCSGEKPPSGKYGTYAMCCSAVAEGPEVDYVEHVEPEPTEVVVHLLAQRLG